MNKKLILLTLPLLLVSCGKTKESNPKEILIYDGNDVLQSKDVFEYKKGDMIKRESFRLNKETKELVLSTRYEFSYDKHHNMLGSNEFLYNTETKQFDLIFIAEYTYNEKNQETSAISSMADFETGELEKSMKIETTYDSNDRKAVEKSFGYDSELKEFYLLGTTTYTYKDGIEMPVLETYTEADEKQPKFMYSREFDEDGNLIVEKTIRTNDDDTVEFYLYDVSGNLVSRSQYDIIEDNDSNAVINFVENYQYDDKNREINCTFGNFDDGVVYSSGCIITEYKKDKISKIDHKEYNFEEKKFVTQFYEIYNY